MWRLGASVTGRFCDQDGCSYAWKGVARALPDAPALDWTTIGRGWSPGENSGLVCASASSCGAACTRDPTGRLPRLPRGLPHRSAQEVHEHVIKSSCQRLAFVFRQPARVDDIPRQRQEVWRYPANDLNQAMVLLRSQGVGWRIHGMSSVRGRQAGQAAVAGGAGRPRRMPAKRMPHRHTLC